MRRKELRPIQLNGKEIISVASNLFQLQNITKVMELDSYDDRNYLIENEQTKTKYLIKFHNGVETEKKHFIEAQIAALKYLKIEGKINCPVDLMPCMSYYYCENRYAVRLLCFIEGDVFYNVVKPNNLDMYEKLGVLIGSVNQKLFQGQFTHPAFDGNNRVLIWDLKNFTSILLFSDSIPNAGNKKMVQDLIQEFTTTLLPNQHKLRSCIIHNDVNDRNVIVQPNGELGLIDFGDMVNTFLVNEVSIALAYIIIGVVTNMEADVILSDRHVNTLFSPCACFFSGYIKLMPLTEFEIECIYILTRARCAASASIGAYSASLNPNNAYLLIHSIPALKVLDFLNRLGKEAFLKNLLVSSKIG